MPQPQVQATGWCLASRRWHEDRLWLSDFGASGVVAIDLQGPSEVIAPVARR